MPPNRVSLRVLATTDVHANLRAYDYYTDTPDQPYGLTRLASLIREARAEAPNTLLLDNGDFLQGTPLSDMTAKPGSDWQGKHPVIAAMNLLGYDAAGLGNHEFNFGVPWLLEMLKQAQFPFTCGNVLTAPDTKGSKPSTLLPPYLILPLQLHDAHGGLHLLKIGILGLVPPQITVWDQYHLAGHIWSSSIDQTAQALVPEMRAAGADLIVVLAHSGFDTGPYEPMMENAVLALTKVPGLDAIVAGHAHKVFPGPGFEDLLADTSATGQVNGIPVVMAGFRGSHLGVVDLELHSSPAGWRVAQSQTTARPVTGRSPSGDGATTEAHDLVEMLDPVHRATKALTSQPLGASDQALHSYLSLIGDCRTIQVVTRAQAAAARQLLGDAIDPDLPFLSASAPFRSGGHGGPDHYCDIPAGQLFLRHAADLYPFPNVLCVAHISGAELREWLERSTTVFHTVQPGQTGQMLLNPAVPNHVFDLVDGLTYQIDITQEALFSPSGTPRKTTSTGRIKRLAYRDRAVRDTDQFIIATNNFRAFGGGPHRMINPDQVIHTGRQPIVDFVSTYIQDASPSLASPQGTWKFTAVPDTEVIFPTGPGLLRHPGDITARGLTHLGARADGFEMFSLPL